MKPIGLACAEALNEAEEREAENAEGDAGGVRVELRVRIEKSAEQPGNGAPHFR
jgi:hypothetical protein